MTEIAELTTWINDHPEDATALHYLGILYSKQQHWPAAISLYEQSIRLNPSDKDTYYHLGLACQKINDLAKAKRAHQLALLIDKKHIGALFQLGILAMQQQTWDSAIECWQQLLQIQLQPEACVNLGNCYLQKNEVSLAKKYFLLAHQIDTQDIQALFNLAVIAERESRVTEAMHYYTCILKLNPKHAETQQNLGIIFLNSKQYNQAILHFNACLSVQPKNTCVRYLLTCILQKNHSNNYLYEKAPVEFLQQLFNQYAPYYDSHMLAGIENNSARFICEALKPWVDESQTNILDIGCGTGECGQQFKILTNHAITMHGLDLSANMLKIAQEKNIYDKLHCDTIENFLSAPKNSQGSDAESLIKYDVILASDVLVYLGNLASIFKIISECLRKKGLFAFTLEKNDKQDWQALPSGRYAHHEQYIRDLVHQNNFRILSLSAKNLRKDEERWIEGWIAVIEK